MESKLKKKDNAGSNTILCPDCDNEVSRNARICIHCGAILKKPKRSFFGKIVLAIFVIFNLYMLIKMANIFAYDFQSDITQGVAFWVVLFQWAIGMIVVGSAVLFTRPK
ncbi:MAG: hypothetical protein LBD19_01715 [Endomicrobium sp.]|jgi:hypothetical protein|nr:hypothetical protein [Endomicrobium sp.]